MSWIDTGVIILVIAVALMIFYQALKEPVDMLGRLLGKAFSSMKEGLTNRKEETQDFTNIEYG